MALEINPLPAPLGLPIAQQWRQLQALLHFIEDANIGLFVEIGLWKGGLAALLAARTVFSPGFSYLGVEKNMSGANSHLGPAPQTIRRIMSFSNAEVLVADAFDHATRDSVREHIIETPGPTLVYCDNGDKALELMFYHEILRVGDYIAAHDYGEELFEKDIKFLIESPYFTEIHPPYWRLDLGIPLFQRINRRE